MELELFSVPELELELVGSNFLFPELELELLSSEFFHRAGAGAYKLQIFIPELELELRVLS